MGNKMYFIQEGIVDIIIKDNEIVILFFDGLYFGGIVFVFVLNFQ